jgi:hypothetical protein
MIERPLRADCAQCCGLCCVGPAFLRIQGFAYDKPPHTSCINLRPDDRCAVHPARQQLGFPACQEFDCLGAGQWVTQQLYGGRSWRDSTQEVASEMFEAYARFRVLHELLAMIDLVGKRSPLATDPVCRLQTLLLQACAREQEEPGTQDLSSLRRRVHAELRQIAAQA